jgi:hypothetical protein
LKIGGKLGTTRQNNPSLEQKEEVNIIRSTVRQDIEPLSTLHGNDMFRPIE